MIFTGTPIRHVWARFGSLVARKTIYAGLIIYPVVWIAERVVSIAEPGKSPQPLVFWAIAYAGLFMALLEFRMREDLFPSWRRQKAQGLRDRRSPVSYLPAATFSLYLSTWFLISSGVPSTAFLLILYGILQWVLAVSAWELSRSVSH